VGSGLEALRLSTGDGRVAILAIGKMVAATLKAAESLTDRGVDATVWDVRSCVPLDTAMLDDAARHSRVVTVEDGVRDGGIGSMIATALGSRSDARVTNLGVPTKFLPQSKPDRLLSQLGLDADGIAASVIEALD
jgi:1-deoxy-D-xylulose-5-phosphate synthase